MHTILIVAHLFLSLGLIGLVLMQHGKGADAGAAFGSGASGTVFGATGAANFLSRATAVLATLFFVTSLTLAWYAMQVTDKPGLMRGVQQQETVVPPTAPATEIPVIPGQNGSAAAGDEAPVPLVPVPEAPKPAE